ncbi:MAG: hypothetical protein AAF790_15310 [Planctomycetota bacterium]
MAKSLTIGGMVVSGLITAAFGIDLIMGFPFDRANSLIDIGMVIAGLSFGYLSWDAFRDIR